MADLLCTDVCAWISHIGRGVTRRALLGLEPRSRIWLADEDKPVLFERMQNGRDGRSTYGLKAAGDTANRWLDLYREYKGSMLELEFVERPVDQGRSAERWRRRFPTMTHMRRERMHA